MPKDTTIKATIDIGANIGEFQQKIKTLENELRKLNLTDGLKDEFNTLFKNFSAEIKNIQNKTSNGELLAIDEKAVSKSFERIGQLFNQMTNKISSSRVTSKWLESDQHAYNKLNDLIKQYTKEIKSADSEVSKINRTIKQQQTEQGKINRQLQEQVDIHADIQKKYGADKTDTEILDIIKEQTEELEKQLAAQKALVNAKAEAVREAKKDKHTQTAEEFKANFKDTHGGSARGWNSQYNKYLKDGILPQVANIEKLTQAQQAYNKEKQEQERIEKEIAQRQKDNTSFNNSISQITKLSDQAKDAAKKIQDLNKDLGAAKTTAFQKVVEQIQQIDDIDWSRFGINPKDIQSVEALNDALKSIEEVGGPEAEKALQGINKILDEAKASSHRAVDGFNQSAQAIDKLTEKQKEIDQLRSRIIHFFSIGNAVQLFKRAIRSAMETVKDLDKVMTETAVVTEFSVGDMWSQLPEYTKRANELGVSIHDVYEASTLYYQQGLKTNEVMAVTNATLRMARIAGLEAAEATDRVTNALRGFNMEINETNADNIADVYSKLAAISASNVDEISTAMTKVASLANSANMQFENTAAFLAQIIETTRESAETAGTALKTVVARFSEVKDLYSKGELLGTDEEGEEIDVNKVSKALRTAGINLNEFLVGQKGLDDIFMELAAKWDELDIVQQRYIATMAAGSRQQSRFIALMSDYKRTQELTTAAQNASGASLEQYNKTLESLETKLTRLKNAWDEFLMSIANSNLIKGAVDLLTGLVQGLNKVTDAISGGNGLLKSVAAIGLSIGGLKLGKNIFNAIFGNPLTGAKGWMAEAMSGLAQPRLIGEVGQKAGVAFFEGFKSLKNMDARAFWLSMFKPNKQFTASELGITELDFRDTRLNFDNIDSNALNNLKNSLTAQVDAAQAHQKNLGVSEEVIASYDSLNKEISEGKWDIARQHAADLNLELKVNQKELDATGQQFKATGQQVQAFGQTVSMIGGLLITLSTILEKVLPNNAKTVTKTIRNVGIALLALPSILKVVSGAVSLFSTEVSASIMSIPFIGWAAAVISAIVAIGTVIAENYESITERAKAAETAFENATDAANGAKDAFDTLTSSLEKLSEQETNIEKLSKGTKAWQDAVQEHNRSVLELIGTYKELDIVSKGGVLSVTNAENIQKIYEQRMYDEAFVTAGANVTHVAADYNALNSSLMSQSTIQDRNRIIYAINRGEIGLNKEQIGNYIKENNLESEWSQQLLSFIDNNMDKEVTPILESLKPLIESSQELALVQKNYATTIANATIKSANLTGEEQKYAETLEMTTNTIGSMYSEFEGFLSTSNLENAANAIGGLFGKTSEQYENLYKRYITTIEGIDAQAIDSNGNFIDKTGRQRYFTEFQAGFVGTLIKQQLSPIYKQLASTLTKYESGSDLEQAIAKAFTAQGEALTIQDLETLMKGDVFEKSLVEVEARARELYAEGGEAKYGDEKIFVESLVENVLNSIGQYRNVGAITEANSFYNFSSGVIQSFNNSFDSYVQDLGKFSSNFINELNKAGITNRSDQSKVINALAGTNLNSIKDIKELSQILSDLGIDTATEEWQDFINYIIETTGALNKIDLTQFKENVTDIKKIITNLQKGDHDSIFTQEEYEKIRPYVDESDFQQSSYGVFYVGDDFDTLGNKIQQAIGDGFITVRKVLEQKLELVDIYQNAQGAGEAAFNRAFQSNEAELLMQRGGTQAVTEWAATERDKAILKSIINQMNPDDLKYLEIPGLSDGNLNINGLSHEEVLDYLTQINTIVNDAVENQAQLNDTEIESRIEGGIGYLLNNWHWNDNNSFDEIALKELISEAGLSDEIAAGIISGFGDINGVEQAASEYNQGLILKRTKEEGLDSQDVKNYADELLRLNKVEDGSIEKALDLSAAYIKVETNTKKLIDTSKDWSNLIGENGPLGKGQQFQLNSSQFKIYDEFKQTLTDALGVVGELNDEFFESVEVGNLLGQIAEGSVEEQQKAYNQLVQLANQASAEIQRQLVLDFILNAENAQYTTDNFIDYVTQRIEEVPDISIEALMNDTQFTDGLNNMITNAGKAGEAIARKLGLQQQYKQVGTQSLVIPKAVKDNKVSQLTYGEMWDNLNTQITSGTIEMPIYALSWEPIAKATTPPDIRSITNGGSGGSKSGSGSGSGGSNKEEKAKQWLNPYDELYNLQQKINTALRERERLEHRYEDMLKDHTKTTDDLVENTLLETASLKKQLAYQKEMLAGRQRQVQNAANEKYEDSEGNITTLGAVGATRYASYDLNTNTVQIDYDEIDKITDENLGKAVEQYISRLEELQGEIVDTEDAIEDISDQLIEIQDRGKEEYLNFEQKIYDALVARREAEIEALENINSSITDAANKTISAIQDEVAKERQSRENEKAEQDIADKEMRLAYLQRDTSGANDLEILKLQKEISNDQQSYQDKIIDQTIQEMQDEATRAEQQRQAQIDLLKDLLEHEKRYGMFWTDVEAKLKGAFDTNGKIKVESDLYQLLKEDANFQALSKLQSFQWTEDISKEIAIAIQGLQNYTLAEAKSNSGKLTLNDGTTLSYDAKTGTWYDSKTKKSYTDADLYWDYNKQSYSLRATNDIQESRPAATTSTSTSSSVKPVTNSKSTTEQAAAPVPVATPQNSEPAKLGKITNTYGWVNVRSTVDTSSYANVIGHTEKGQSFDVLGYGDYGWYKIKLPNGQVGYTAVHQNGTPLYSFTKYKEGGLADFTGPAWLDGTRSRPEMVLNAADTQNFIALKDILASILKNTSGNNKSISTGDTYFDIDIQAEIDSDYDVDRLAERIKKQIYDAAEYRNVNAISLMR